MGSSANRSLRVGVSSCLLGAEVRFDGGHKRDRFVADELGAHVEFVAVCPEVEMGLGVPRETIRLERAAGEVRLVAPKSGRDHTQAMKRWSKARLRELAGLDLDGWVLKKGSPSCGLERVRVYEAPSPPRRDGRGLFASALVEACPDLPVEEEGRLNDPRLRENFVERLFAYRRMKDLFGGRWTVGDLVRFHTNEKLTLLAHDPQAYRALGRVVAAAKGRERKELASEYRRAFMGALGRLATRGRQANVLGHIQGYFRDQIRSAERRELSERIEDYRRGLVPLVVPLTLVRHYVRILDVEYVAGQSYLEPHPMELMLRNHV